MLVSCRVRQNLRGAGMVAWAMGPVGAAVCAACVFVRSCSPCECVEEVKRRWHRLVPMVAEAQGPVHLPRGTDVRRQENTHNGSFVRGGEGGHRWSREQGAVGVAAF